MMRIVSIALGAVLLGGYPLLAPAQVNVERLSIQGREAMKNGRYTEAVRLYEQMVSALPNEPGARLNLALALDAAGRTLEALKNLERIKASQGANSQFWFLLGIEYQKLRRSAQAVEPLERAVKLAPNNADYRVELADAYLGRGASDLAAATLRALASKRPNDVKISAGLVRTYLAMAREAYQALVKVAPESSLGLALVALSEAETGNRPKAAAVYRQALLAQPPAPWLNAELNAIQGDPSPLPSPDGESGSRHPLEELFRQGAHERIVSASKGSIAPEVLYWRARACSELARASLTRIASLPPSAEAHELGGLAFREAGRWEDSLAEYREAVRLAPTDNRMRSELAKSLWLSRRYEDAAKLIQQLVAGGMEQGELEFELGDSLFNLGQPEPALVHLRRALALSPADFAIQAMLGRVLLQLGDSQGAAMVLERVARQDIDGTIHFQLSTAYRNLGRAAEARRALDRKKEIDEAARGRAGADAHEPPPQ
jgi:tetratricopeptide (TPR) repeat protein